MINNQITYGLFAIFLAISFYFVFFNLQNAESVIAVEIRTPVPVNDGCRQKACKIYIKMISDNKFVFQEQIESLSSLIKVLESDKSILYGLPLILQVSDNIKHQKVVDVTSRLSKLLKSSSVTWSEGVSAI